MVAKTIINRQVAPIMLKDVFQNFKKEIFLSMHCIKVGKITKFNKTKKTAEVQIMLKRVLPDNSIKDYPQLLSCPVMTLQGNGGSIQFPIVAGDDCIVLFSDRSIDTWLNNGTAAAPTSSRAHDLTDAIAIVGLNSYQSSLPAYTDDVVLTVPSGQNFIVNGVSAEAHILGDQKLALLSDVTQLRADLNTFITTIYNLHMHPTAAVGAPSAPTVTGSSPTAPVGTNFLKGS
jgi:hypothetical protein